MLSYWSTRREHETGHRDKEGERESRKGEREGEQRRSLKPNLHMPLLTGIVSLSWEQRGKGKAQRERKRGQSWQQESDKERVGEEKERFETANEMVKSRKTTFAVRCKYNGKWECVCVSLSLFLCMCVCVCVYVRHQHHQGKEQQQQCRI